ncbi:hypothetical protein FF2_009791 [Malus domestica]
MLRIHRRLQRRLRGNHHYRCDSEQTDKDWPAGGRSDPRPLVGGGRRKKDLLVTRARVTRSTPIASKKDP